jgi:hypothetical protein
MRGINPAQWVGVVVCMETCACVHGWGQCGCEAAWVTWWVGLKCWEAVRNGGI